MQFKKSHLNNSWQNANIKIFATAENVSIYSSWDNPVLLTRCSSSTNPITEKYKLKFQPFDTFVSSILEESSVSITITQSLTLMMFIPRVQAKHCVQSQQASFTLIIAYTNIFGVSKISSNFLHR